MKVGDRVKILHSCYTGKHVQVGQLGIIDEIKYDTLYSLIMDLDPSTDWPFYANELEVVKE